MFYNPVLKALRDTVHIGSFLAYSQFLVVRELSPAETQQLMSGLVPLGDIIEATFVAEAEVCDPNNDITNKRKLH